MPTSQSLEKIWEEYKSIFWKKLADYGTEDISEMGLLGVITRMNDKMSRIKNLIKQDSDPKNESFRDSLLDLFGYSLIGLLVYDGEWEERLRGKFAEYSDIVPGDPALRPKELKNVLLIKSSKDGCLCKPAKEGDVGHDLIVAEDTLVLPLPQAKATLIPSHVNVLTPEGYFSIIYGRSSAANKRGLFVVPAVIDQQFTGELCACVFNMTSAPVLVKKGEHIGQVVFFPITIPQAVNVLELPITERDTSGFGSTGL